MNTPLQDVPWWRNHPWMGRHLYWENRNKFPLEELLKYNNKHVAWFPDGSGVVFMSEGRDGNWDLYRANVADGTVTRLTNDTAPDGLPAVSPDGTQIAFISKRGGSWALWVMPSAGGEARQLAPIEGELPDWLLQAVDWAR